MHDPSHSVYESILTAILLATNKQIDNHHASILSNQEHRLSKVCNEFKGGTADRHSSIVELQSSMTFTVEQVDATKNQLKWVGLADTSVMVKRLQHISIELVEHEQQLDYLENQSCRNNIQIDGILEEKDESWDSTE